MKSAMTDRATMETLVLACAAIYPEWAKKNSDTLLFLIEGVYRSMIMECLIVGNMMPSGINIDDEKEELIYMLFVANKWNMKLAYDTLLRNFRLLGMRDDFEQAGKCRDPDSLMKVFKRIIGDYGDLLEKENA